MKEPAEIELLGKTIGQVEATHAEISAPSRNSNNDAVNQIRLNIVDKVPQNANRILGPSYEPFDRFFSFEVDDAPSNSDITLVVAFYIKEIERFRKDNIVWNGVQKVYLLNGKPSNISPDAT